MGLANGHTKCTSLPVLPSAWVQDQPPKVWGSLGVPEAPNGDGLPIKVSAKVSSCMCVCARRHMATEDAQTVPVGCQ